MPLRKADIRADLGGEPTAQTPSLIISSVAAEADGSLHIGYHQPEIDRHPNGVITVHTMFVPFGDDYDDEIMVALQTLRHLVLDVLDDLPRLAPPLPDEPDED